ncbi:hypothetical protein RJT34_18959 [Clitoria ternatea]|uniref:Uncharacterized protein n=1 Tax=Clitoria ternatea TaxID=43366 RepID=A0AAN9IQ44_CLITE
MHVYLMWDKFLLMRSFLGFLAFQASVLMILIFTQNIPLLKHTVSSMAAGNSTVRTNLVINIFREANLACKSSFGLVYKDPPFSAREGLLDYVIGISRMRLVSS